MSNHLYKFLEKNPPCPHLVNFFKIHSVRYILVYRHDVCLVLVCRNLPEQAAEYIRTFILVPPVSLSQGTNSHTAIG